MCLIQILHNLKSPISQLEVKACTYVCIAESFIKTIENIENVKIIEYLRDYMEKSPEATPGINYNNLRLYALQTAVMGLMYAQHSSPSFRREEFVKTDSDSD